MSGYRKPIIFLVCFGVLGSSIRADVPSSPSASPTGIKDIALSESGSLKGSYLDHQGRAVPGAIAVLTHGDQPLAKTTTDQSGSFAFTKVKGGVYRIVIGPESQTVRVWNSAAKPPAARPMLTMIQQDPVIRAQMSSSLTTQIAVAAGIGGLIVGGIALAESEDAKDEAAALRRVLKVSSP